MSRAVVWKLGWVLVHSLWQVAAVAVVLAVVLGLLRKASANARYLASCGALILMVAFAVATMWLVEAPGTNAVSTMATALPDSGIQPSADVVPSTASPVERVQTPASPVAAAEPPEASRFALAADKLEASLPYLVAAWLLGVFGLSLWHLGGWAQLQRLKRRMVEPVTNELKERADSLAERLRIRQAVAVVRSALVQVPTVIGWLKPVILLPAGALTGLSAEQLEALLAHELAHVKRHDYLVNMLQTAIEILGFYHPAVWWVSRRIRMERENCCDDIAAEVAGNRVLYADALATMEELRGRPGLALAASGGSLLTRVRRLCLRGEEGTPRTTWFPAFFAIGMLIAVMLVGRGLLWNAMADEHEERPGTQDRVGIGLSGRAKTGTGESDTLVRELTLDAGWDVGELLTRVAKQAGLELRVADGGPLDRRTGKPLECAAVMRFKQAHARDVLAWMLHAARLSATVSDGVIRVRPSDGPGQVPEGLAIRPNAAGDGDFLPAESRTRTVSLKQETEWDPAQLFEFLCHVARVPRVVIAADVRGGHSRYVTIQFTETPLPEAFGKALEAAGCELLVDRDTVFIRRFPVHGPLRVSGRVTDAQTGAPIPDFRVILGTGKRGTRQALWDRGRTVAGSEGRFELRFEERERDDADGIRVEAKGYLVTEASVFAADSTGRLDINLTRGTPLTGRVLLPDGRPAVGVDIVPSTPEWGVIVDGRPPSARGEYLLRTDENGAFALADRKVPFLVTALHEAGYAELAWTEAGGEAAATLVPWARVSGTVRGVGPTGMKGQLRLFVDKSVFREGRPAGLRSERFQSMIAVDEHGRFELDRVPPGRIRLVSNMGATRTGVSAFIEHVTPLNLKPGETRHVELGRPGRSVVGRIVLPSGMEDVEPADFQATMSSGDFPLPPGLGELPEPERLVRLREWEKSEEGKAAMFQHWRRSHNFTVPGKGTFRVDDVPPGKYILHGPLCERADGARVPPNGPPRRASRTPSDPVFRTRNRHLCSRSRRMAAFSSAASSPQPPRSRTSRLPRGCPRSPRSSYAHIGKRRTRAWFPC